MNANPLIFKVQQKVADGAFGTPLITNVLRGHVAEAIVALALEPDWLWCAKDYASWDFENADGIRLEIKQSAAKQSWSAYATPSRASFDIKERTGRWEGEQWVAESGRAAQIYVFARHPLVDETTDHRDPYQWEFYVVSTRSLPDQKSISLSRVKQIGSQHSFDDLAQGVRDATANCR